MLRLILYYQVRIAGGYRVTIFPINSCYALSERHRFHLVLSYKWKEHEKLTMHLLSTESLGNKS